MIEKIKEVERTLMLLYDDLQDLFPETHCLTFSVTQTKLKEPSYLYGFIHIGGECHYFNSMTDLIVTLRAKAKENQVLHQNFDGLREALK